MGFADLIDKVNGVAMSRFANVIVTVTLGGAVVKSFPGIFDQEVQVVSPYETDRAIGKPAVSALTSDLSGVTSAHDLEINGITYRFDGKPRPDGAGMTTTFLAVKK